MDDERCGVYEESFVCCGTFRGCDSVSGLDVIA